MSELVRVLHIDDSAADRELVCDALEREPGRFEVVQAATREEIKARLADGEYDVVLSDFNILGLDGFDVIDLIREKSPHVPVIIVTGTGSETIAVETMKRGAADYVIKTLSHIRRLPLTIQAALEKARLQAEQKRAEAERERLLHDTGERVKELRCMYSVAESIRKRETLEQVFEDVVAFIPPSWQYPEVTRCRIRFDDQEYVSQPFEKTQWRQHADIAIAGEPRGTVEVFYLEQRPELDEGPFLKEERDLIDGIARALSEAVEHKQAQKERERLTHAIEQAAETIVITDAEGAIQYVNPAFEQITGYTCEEAIGQNPRILKSGQQDDAFYKDMWDTLTRGDVWNGRIVNKRKDHTLYTEEATISPVRDASGRTVNYVAVKRDITEEMKLEEQLHQAQKMEAVGRLAGGVAHDFNNMLSVIFGNAELALSQVDPSRPLHENLLEIQRAAQRSADLTRQLLAFARKQTVSPKVLDLNETVESMFKMLQRLIGEDIALTWRPAAELWPVKMDPSQVDQALANLCVNSRDAIDGVGKITIETENVRFGEAYCVDHPGLVPGQYVQLAVSDNGCGMGAETLARVFEPFFTTKGAGEGTGLGLATVHGVVKQNDGFVNAYSEPGHGSTFRIYLPRHMGKAEQLRAQGPHEPASRGHETVLFVEDERAILKLGKAMLESLGYRVLTAGTPGEAIRLAEEHPSEIHLLVTDVVMPEMNGRDLAKRILTLYPGIKRLFMSGYTANVIAHRGVLAEGVHFMEKPFSQQDIASKVRETLNDE